MNVLVLGWFITVSQLILAAGMCCALWRIIIGPRAQDRVLGFDTLYVNVMLVIITLGVQTGSSDYFEAAVIVALLGFAATVAFAKFLMRGEVIE